MMHEDLLERIKDRTATIAIIGLGYVGLPTAEALAEVGFPVVGADLNEARVRELNEFAEANPELKDRVDATIDPVEAARKGDVILIIVPTPITKDKNPDMRFVKMAGDDVAKVLRPGQLVILESTVYPGATETVLLPALEASGLKAGKDFGIGYCPERFNPGDTDHTVTTTPRIVSAIDLEWREIVIDLYSSIIEAQIFPVSQLRTAEAAKVIENIQRDLNIALINEFALIFERMGIDVVEVIEAASTKWNFLKFRPGSGVGGHCLPVDPYYLLKAAESTGHYSRLITAGREVNDRMPRRLFRKLSASLNHFSRSVKDSRILVMGMAYKGNVDDARESPSKTFLRYIISGDADIHVLDPHIDPEVMKDWGTPVPSMTDLPADLDAVVVMTDHDIFKEIDLELLRSRMRTPIFIDGHRMFDPTKLIEMGFHYEGVGWPGLSYLTRLPEEEEITNAESERPETDEGYIPVKMPADVLNTGTRKSEDDPE